MTTRRRNKKRQGVNDTPLTLRTEENEKPLVETSRKIVKDEPASHHLAIKKMINDNIKITNDHFDEILEDVADLKKSFEVTQDQMKEEINRIKKDLKE